MNSDKNITEQRVILTSFLVDVLDVIVNLVVAIFTGSVIMFSEFFQGAADLTASGFLLIGHKKAKKKPDKRHPFGHGKEIYFWTLISAVIMMTLTATASFYLGFNRLIHPEPIRHIYFAFVALTIAAVTNAYAFYLSMRRLLQDTRKRFLPLVFLNSNAVAAKNTLVLDLMGTLAAGFGLISLFVYQLTGEARLDGVGAMVIGVTTAILAFLLIVAVKSFLIGKRAPSEVEKKIKQAALEIRQVKEILDLRTMQFGADNLIVNMEVHMQNELTTDQIEILIDRIKKNIRADVPSVQHIQIELETPES